MEKCQDLKREIGTLRKLKKVEVIPVVTGALGSVTKEFDGWVEKQCWSDTRDCIVGNCRNIEKSVGDVKKISFC